MIKPILFRIFSGIFVVLIAGCIAGITPTPTIDRNPKYEPIVGEPMPTLTNSSYPVRQGYVGTPDGRIITIMTYVSAETQNLSYFTVQIEGTERSYQIVDIPQDRLYVDSDVDGLVDEIIDNWTSANSINELYGIPKPGKRI